jgi:hypothetical protein
MRARLRKQALDWLRADLVLRTRQLGSGQPAASADVWQKLNHWRRDHDLAGIRDKEALAKLSAEERAACEKLWSDVAESSADPLRSGGTSPSRMPLCYWRATNPVTKKSAPQLVARSGRPGVRPYHVAGNAPQSHRNGAAISDSFTR